MCGAETWTLRDIDQKYVESFDTWCWRRMEISWTDRVRSEVMLERVKEERNVRTGKESRLTGLVTSCVGTAFENTLLKERHKGREDEEKDVRSYWITFTK